MINEDITYPNKNFGKNGWLYWFLPLLLGGSIIIIYILIFSIINSGYSYLEKELIFLGILYFCYYLILGVQILIFGAKTAKQVLLIDGCLFITTYLGKTYSLKNIPEVIDTTNNPKLTKKHMQLLYPLECCILTLSIGRRKQYLPIKQNGDYLRLIQGKEHLGYCKKDCVTAYHNYSRF